MRQHALLTRAGQAGQNSVPYTGRVGRRKLAPGKHRATFVAVDAGLSSAPRTLHFRVVR